MRSRQNDRSKRKLFFRIFGVFTIILLVWIIFFLPTSQTDNSDESQVDTLALNDNGTIPAEVSDFVTFVRLSSDTITSNETDEYASMGIEQLSLTIESFIDRNSSSYHSMTRDTDEMKEIAGELSGNKVEDGSEKAKKAFLIAAELLNMQGIANSDVIKSRAEAINKDVPLEKQLDNVKSYFLTVSDAFREMTGMEEKKL